ncbi:MAG: hypothetical protein AB3X37_09015 [Leptothrix ochracea]|uniref:hypothetical protein n=1 Tax=Leptothrix ochracea TaxID=735331 RepID=UPI0034E1A43F
MSTSPRIARHQPQNPDPLGFESLREQGIGWAQEASGKLWTDYNLHDPGVTLLEALCYALTEDIFLARQEVPTLLQLSENAPPAAWARLGLYQPGDLLPCRPLTEMDWQLWLRRQLPHARQLQMQAQLDPHGRFTGLWQLRLQAPEEELRQGLAGQMALRQHAMQLFWQQRNLGEDLAHPPQWLAPRWVRLQFKIVIHGERNVYELLAEILQRCDDLISGRFSALPAATGGDDPQAHAHDIAEGPLREGPTAAEIRWAQTQQQPLLHASDIARHLADIEGLAEVDTLSLEPLETFETSETLPTGSVRRYGPHWALRLQWPNVLTDLQDWQLWRDGAHVQLDRPSLLEFLSEQRQVMAWRRNNARTESAPPLHHPSSGSALHHEAYPASAALPAVYRETLHQYARHQPGLKDQWTGYLALLEQGLMQVQMQREQIPRLYALDQDERRSTWPSLPSDAQLPGLEDLLETPLAELLAVDDLDEDPLGRRHRLLDYQLALHGEALDHSALQGLPCYFSPTAWAEHLLHLKRHFARRLLRLSKDRTGGADYSQPLLGSQDNTPPLQERLALMLGMAHTHSRLLSTATQSQADNEGLHLVEWLLLRPIHAQPSHPHPPHAQEEDDAQLLFVFSGWTARGQDPRFRRLAEQGVAREAPAHLRCRCLWLEADAMTTFEQHWQAWLDARRQYTQAVLIVDTNADESAPIEPLAQTLDHVAATLKNWLRDMWMDTP